MIQSKYYVISQLIEKKSGELSHKDFLYKVHTGKSMEKGNLN